MTTKRGHTATVDELEKIQDQKIAVFAFVKAKHICFLGRFGGELPQEESWCPLGGVRRGSPRTPPVLFFFPSRPPFCGMCAETAGSCLQTDNRRGDGSGSFCILVSKLAQGKHHTLGRVAQRGARGILYSGGHRLAGAGV